MTPADKAKQRAQVLMERDGLDRATALREAGRWVARRNGVFEPEYTHW